MRDVASYPFEEFGMLSLSNSCRWIVVAFIAFGSAQAVAEECDSNDFESTFELIQAAIFEPRGCTNQICHGAAAEGGLDMRPEVAWENLVDVDATTVPGWKRVLAGQTAPSLLWLNLAAKTLPTQHQAPLRAMPLDPVPALSEDELEAVRLWIEHGASKDGIVRGTAELLDACLPPPRPIEIRPLDPPAPGAGVQIAMPGRYLAPQSEEEVCFATYYDVSDQVPAEFRNEAGTHFRYKRHLVRQDPLSHHLIPFSYAGVAAANDPVWGDWNCVGGDVDGQPCDPLESGVCGDGGFCRTRVVKTVACIGFGPGDAGVGLQAAGISVTQETAAEFEYGDGVFDELPLRGIVLWDSHAFNLADEPGLLRGWLNFEFAEPDKQISKVQPIFDASNLFAPEAAPFMTDEPCNIFTFPPNAHLLEVSTHMHRFGKRFRIFDGQFTCHGGANDGEACSPLGYDFVSPDVCRGFPCRSVVRKRAGDCDLSGDVTVDEVISGVNIALGVTSRDVCPEADVDGDLVVSVDEVITGVSAALTGVPAPVERDPEGSMFYISFVYDDPVVMRYSPPRVFNPGTREDERSFTFCALYDNGHTDPSLVKRKSTSPATPVNFPGIGGPCGTPTHCTDGLVGEACSGRTASARDASCDTVAGAGDGFCDACTLRGGVTTEDEMFLLLGSFFVP